MRNKTILLLWGLIFLLSCTEEDLVVSLGDNFINSQTTISLIDSISVQISTFKIDSLAITGSTFLMAGAYTDSEFGVVTSSAYFQLEMPTAIIDDDEIFDSLVIRLPYSGFSYGDTLQEQTIDVYRILEDIEPKDDELYLYNTSTFGYSENPVGSKSLKPRPNFHNEIEIRLLDELGRELLELLRNEEDEISTSSDFLELFKGVVLVPGNEKNVLLSFLADTTVHMELHTHVVAEEKIENIYDFPLNNTLTYFNNISGNVNGLPLVGLTTQREELKSAELDNKAYLQAGLGLVTRVDFSGISKILEVERYNILYKAELVLKPVPGTYNDVSLPETLVLYNTDKYNNLISEIVDDEGYSIPAEFYYDEFYNESNYYRFDVTAFIHQELSDGFVDPDNGLLIMMPTNEFQGTVDRIVFDVRSDSKYRPMLKLYYVFYE